MSITNNNIPQHHISFFPTITSILHLQHLTTHFQRWRSQNAPSSPSSALSYAIPPLSHQRSTNNPQYLLFLTLLAAYTMHLSRLHSLPLPRALSAFTLALPLITGLLISSITTLPSSQPLLLKPNGNKSASHQPQQWQNYTLLLLTILSTVLATLNGTYLPSSPTQTCALDTKWQSMFSRHDGKAIQRIQDAFECCGLHSVVDKAFPFPSKNVGVDACSKTFRRTQSCFNDWRGEEQRVAGLGLVVIIGAVLWEVRHPSTPFVHSFILHTYN